MRATTVRIPLRLRTEIAADAERCGRSFQEQVVAILRHHYGESVDIVPTPALILALAEESLAGLSAADRALVTARSIDHKDLREELHEHTTAD